MKSHLVLMALLAGSTVAARAGELAQWHQAHQTENSVTVTRRYEEPKPSGVTEIGLERTMCYGTCPDYTVTIRSDGRVSYDGGRYAPRHGKFTGRVSPYYFETLARFIVDSNFAKLADSYTAGVTDNPTIYTSVVRNGKRKVVSDYARSGPASLWAIEELIDDLVSKTTWDKPVGTSAEKPAKQNGM